MSLTALRFGRYSRRVFVAGVFVVLGFIFVSSSVQAADITYVQGHVFDTDGSPLVNVDVSVTMKYLQGGVWTTRSTVSVTSGSGGYYLATFGGFTGKDWQDGDRIEVVATKPGVGQSLPSIGTANVGEVTQTPDIDVQFETAIPQLGGVSGFLVSAGVLGIVAIVAMGVWRRVPTAKR